MAMAFSWTDFWFRGFEGKLVNPAEHEGVT